MSNRTILFVQATPVPEFETVTCYEDSWICHIAAEHTDVADKLSEVQEVISDPSYVLIVGTRATNNVVFFNETIVNDQNEPMFVIVNRDKLDMRTAYYKTAWKNFQPSMTNPHTVIWKKKP